MEKREHRSQKGPDTMLHMVVGLKQRARMRRCCRMMLRIRQ